MYNLFQYTRQHSKNRNLSQQNKQQLEITLRHQQYKKQAYFNMQMKANQFLSNQTQAKEPYLFEDNRSFLTGVSSKLGNKEKSLMSNFQASKNPFTGFQQLSNSRQQQYLEDGIPIILQGNSSQRNAKNTKYSNNSFKNPMKSVNPEDYFYVSEYDKTFLSPPVHQTHRPSNQCQSRFQQKAEKLNKQFQSYKARYDQVRRASMDRYYDQTSSGIHGGQYFRKKTLSKNIRHQYVKSNKNMEIKEDESNFITENYIKQRNDQKRKGKTYFKLAKTMTMFHPSNQRREQFKSLMKSSFYDREKLNTKMGSSIFLQTRNTK